MGRKQIPMIGRRFGRLVVQADTGEKSRRHAIWRCRCDCGASVPVIGDNLRSGHTQSCGCYHSDVMRSYLGAVREAAAAWRAQRQGVPA